MGCGLFKGRLRNQASYVKLFNDVHYVNVLAGIEARRNAYEGFSVQNYGWTPNFGEKYNPIMTDTYKDWLASGNATPTNNNSFTQVASFYGTAAYSYADRYVLNFNMRSDGSNKFGSNPKYRWQPTYSFALKWNMMSEDFMAQYKSYIDYLSFRGSYGTQGNISVDDSPNLIIRAGTVDNLLGVVTSDIYRLPNPDLRWEKTRSWDAAFDFSLLKGRIRGSFDTYGKYTNDLIMTKFVASSNGMSSMYYNAGKMTNKGFEGFVNASLYKNRDWEWRVGVNFSRNINKITLANLEDFSDAEIVNRMMNGTLAIEGAPIGTLYSYHFAGLNEENGLPMFYTKDGRKSLVGNKTDMELVDCGSIFPKLTGGFDTQLTYKDFSLSMAFTYSLGAVGRLPEYYAGGTSYIDPLSNVSKEWLNCWTNTNTNTNTNSPAPYSFSQMNTYLATASGSAYNTYDATLGGTRVYPYEMYNKSDVRVAKANFLKMKMLALSYNFPKHLVAPLNVSSLMLRLQITNLFCIAGKDWHGVDPEIGVTQIPSLPTYSLGVNVSF